MKTITINGPKKTYPIYIGNDIRFSIESYFDRTYSSILVITDEHVRHIYLEEIRQRLNHSHTHFLVLSAGEETKTIKHFYHIHTKALEYGLDRKSLIIALGGGVIGDIAGFAAATYMRGIDYIQMPTTLLAHDSSVGGKVAINHGHAKNIIGAFYPPKAVVYDIQTLNTLPPKEIRSGYAELIKEALIADESYFYQLLDTSLNHVTNEQMKEHVIKGITIKTQIVEEDEQDHGQRHFLNFGHTFGHALESVLGMGNITHGEAVAIGLLFAIYVSERTFHIHLPYKELQEWMKWNGYPFTLKAIQPERLYRQMAYDKKKIRSQINMVLLQHIGKPILYPFDNQTIKRHIHSFLNHYQ
ncbi:MAG TPA: 3-dehydroquinate synthase [Virgibacillus sp.]|nr:3-dehydroquinate synthase [Virgibacillus sp.]